MKNYKNIYTLLSIATLAGIVLTFAACSGSGDASKSDDHEGHGHSAVESHSATETTFVEGKGVQLSEVGRVAVGLETAPVTAETRTVGKEIQLQVYRHANEADQPSGKFRNGYAYASAIIPAVDARKLSDRQSIDITQGDSSQSAEIAKIDWQLESVTGEAEVIAQIKDPEAQYAIGSFIQGHLTTANTKTEDLVSIPRGALLTTAKGSFAYASNNEYFFRTPVKVVGNTDEHALISDGLFEGDIVASNGVQQLYLIELQTINGGKGCAGGH